MRRPASVARHWLDGGNPREALPWLLAAAREAVRLAAFSDALAPLEPCSRPSRATPRRLRLRAESLDAWATRPRWRPTGRRRMPPASRSARPARQGALAQVKQGDPKGALLALEACGRRSVEGRLCEALAYSGAAALGVGDPADRHGQGRGGRRLALESGDTSSLVIASWAQAAAAHARGDLHRSVWADLQETSHVPHLAVRVFDGHLCITQRFLYGARPYAEVIAFAERPAAEGAAARRGARPRLRRHAARRGRVAAPATCSRRGEHLREGAAAAPRHRRRGGRSAVAATPGRGRAARRPARRGARR